ncbi:hypothetical protein AMJ40_00605 [candidate division TA06 bacterium DG_26]|uniref:Sigma-54 factor interaction domain-containing protein n=1 Tax=candidate division TA06 bacterium DG_26 TaxID=1703771 RepID=A0A0S7WM70_UNCT6|nr:MAG: hypothetical protein AMJ40_00605 [candidate division TA06 bacterium DG_26]
MRSKILLLGTSLTQRLRRVLGDEYELIAVTNLSLTSDLLKRDEISAVLVDFINPVKSLDTLYELKAAHPDLRFIGVGVREAPQSESAPVMSEWIEFPLTKETVLRKLTQSCAGVGEQSVEFYYGNMIGNSPAIRKVFEQIDKIADTDCSVLITGDGGTGKELVARSLHYKSSRRHEPFKPVSCGAFASTLLESELFGHVRGSFTGAIKDKKGKFEVAGKGTIFLDEIGEMELALQVKLLRVLQEREFEKVGGNQVIKMNARVISATNRNLEAAVRDGTFREDLYYRINVVEVYLPPLRCRKEDIALLADYFLKKFRKQCRRDGVSITPEAMEALMSFSWPGNVRQLENFIQRALCLSDGDVIKPEHFNFDSQNGHRERRRVTINRSVHDLSLPEAVESVEKRMIYDALRQTKWVRVKAARLLGITERMLGYKMNKYGITPGT